MLPMLMRHSARAFIAAPHARDTMPGCRRCHADACHYRCCCFHAVWAFIERPDIDAPLTPLIR